MLEAFSKSTRTKLTMLQSVFLISSTLLLVSGQSNSYYGAGIQPASAPVNVQQPLTQQIPSKVGMPGAVPQQYMQQQQQPIAIAKSFLPLQQTQPSIQIQPPAPVNAEQKPVLDCSGRQDGIYVLNQRHCSTGFWKCSNGFAYEFACPADLVFSVEDMRCDYRQFVPACGGTRPPPAPEAVAPTTTPEPVDFNCQGKTDGHYYKQPCDSTFYTCTGGVPTKLFCPDGTGYDPIDQQCEYVAACGKPKPAPQNVAQTTQQQIQTSFVPVPQPNQPSYSYGQQTTPAPVAVAQPQPQPIPYGAAPAPVAVAQPQPQQPQATPYGAASAPVAVAQPQPQQPQATPYGTAPAPVAVAQPTPTTTTQAPVDFDCSNLKDGHYYKTKCDSTFYLCSGGIPTRLTCPVGTGFDPTDLACEYVEVCGKPKPPPAAVDVTSNAYAAQPQAPVAVAQPQPQQPQATPYGAAPAPVAVAQPQPQQPQATPYSAAPAPVAVAQPQPQQPQATPYSAAPAPVAVAQPQQPQATPYGAAPAPVAVAQPTTTTTQAPISVDFDCSGKADGYYYKKSCDSTFYSCSSGTSIRFSCPMGTGFDPTKRSCQNGCGQPQTTQAPVAVAQPQPVSTGYTAPIQA